MKLSNFLIALSLFPVANIKAEDNDHIIISADRISETIKSTSSTIKVITEKELRQNNYASIEDALKQSANLNIITSGPIGNNSSLFMRGMDSSHTLVVLDGIVLNDPSNPNRSFDFSKISLSNIEKIEILKGAQGLLYGSNAIGGVVVINTKKKKANDLSNEMNVSFGTYNTSQLALSTMQTYSEQNLSFGIEHLNSGGFSTANDYTHTNDKDGVFKQAYNLGLNSKISPSLSYDFKAHLIKDKIDLDKGGGPNQDDPNYKSKSQEIYSKLELLKTWNDSYRSKFFYSYINNFRQATDESDPYQSYSSPYYYKGYNHNFYIENNLNLTESATQNFSLGFNQESDFKHKINSEFIFLYNKIELDFAQINLGLRNDHHEIFGNQITYKIGISKQLNNFTIRSSHGTGLRAPSINQLYDTSYGNLKLTPEKSKSYDLGIDGKFGNFSTTTTFFYNYITDRLTYHPTTYVNINAGKSDASGIEQEIAYQFSQALDTNLQYTLTEAYDLSKHKRMARRPESMLTHKVNWHDETFSLTFESIFSSQRPDIDNNGADKKVDAFFINHFNYAYYINSNSKLTFKVKNVFNRNYCEIWGYNTGGRMITLGYDLKF